MKKITFAILLVLGAIINMQAQNVISTNDNTIFSKLNNGDGNLSYEQIKGTPYINDTLQEAIIRGREQNNVYLIRYDAYQGLIHYKEKGKDHELKSLSAQSAYCFDFVNKNQSYVTLVYPGLEKGFGLVVWRNEDGVELIKKETITFVKGKNADGGYGTYVADSFSSIKEDYFIRLQENGEVVRIPSKKKDILSFLGKDVEKKAKEEKLNPKKEQDLIKLLTWKYTKQ